MKRIIVFLLQSKILSSLFLIFFTATLFAPEDKTLISNSFTAAFGLGPSISSWSSLKPEISLEGSPKSLIWQNLKLDFEGLRRIRNDSELQELVKSGALAPLPLDDCLEIDKGLGMKWYFVLPQTAKFLQDLSEMVCPEFNKPLKINSAVRHKERQLELIYRENNPNAAPISGERASPHLTGASVDIATLGFPQRMVRRMTEIALEFERIGLLEATLETEFQYVLHVTVFREYVGYPGPLARVIANAQ